MRILADPLVFTACLCPGRGHRPNFRRPRPTTTTAAIAYSIAVTRRGRPINLTGLVNSLPTWMRESDFGNSLKTASYTLAPTSVRFRSGLNRDETNFFSYVSPVMRPIDATVVPALALNYVWRNPAGLTWQPIGMLTFNADVARRATSASTATRPRWHDWPRPSREDLLGVDVGVERDRTTGTSLLIAPRIASWFRPAVRHEQQLRAQPLPQQPPAGARGRRHGRRLHPAADLLQPAQLRVGFLDRLCAGHPAAGGRLIGGGQRHPAFPPARRDPAHDPHLDIRPGDLLAVAFLHPRVRRHVELPRPGRTTGPGRDPDRVDPGGDRARLRLRPHAHGTVRRDDDGPVPDDRRRAAARRHLPA